MSADVGAGEAPPTYDVVTVRWSDGGRSTIDLDAVAVRRHVPRVDFYAGVAGLIERGVLRPLGVPGAFASPLSTWEAAALGGFLDGPRAGR